jgi:hypothetical protein
MALATSKFCEDFELGCRTSGAEMHVAPFKSRTPELLNL